MPIKVLSKRKSIQTITKEFNEPLVIDVTSKSEDKFVAFSPFYPHHNIPVPFSGEYRSKSVEGIWQGLKVFENQDVDVTKFEISSMKGLKRTTRKFGQPLGHRKGVNGDELFNYLEARKNIYLPSYEWILKNKIINMVEELYTLSKTKQIILLDYETNTDLYNLKSPLSHAGLIKIFIENDYTLNLF